MTIQNFKKYAFAFALGLGFIVAPAVAGFSTAQAQGHWNRRDGNYGRQDRNRNGVNDRYENNRDINIDRNRNGVDDRYEIDRNRNGVDDRYENNRNDRNRNGVN